MGQDKSHHPYFTIAFYNLENLFDTFDNPYIDDDDFLPKAERRWTPKRYKKKVRKLGYTISKIGFESTQKPPAVVGLAEVENKLVVEDLISSKFLEEFNYGIVHYDSPDERGIDVAMIYNKTFFDVLTSHVYPLDLVDEFGKPDHTRDILLVKGNLNGEIIYVLVNHWPSRRQGEEETEPNRLKASAKAIEIIDDIKHKDLDAKIIIMGDFNDSPKNKSVRQIIETRDFYNPMDSLQSFIRGSLGHHRAWYLFDQIIFTTNFFKYQKDKHSFSQANIFDMGFLKEYKGKYKGFPFRTYVGKKYKGGYSDHFPVYIHLKKQS